MAEYLSIRIKATGKILQREKKAALKLYERLVKSQQKTKMPPYFEILDAPIQKVVIAEKKSVVVEKIKTESTPVAEKKKPGRPKKKL